MRLFDAKYILEAYMKKLTCFKGLLNKPTYNVSHIVERERERERETEKKKNIEMGVK